MNVGFYFEKLYNLKGGCCFLLTFVYSSSIINTTGWGVILPLSARLNNVCGQGN